MFAGCTPAGAEIKLAAQNAQLGAASVLIGIRPTFAQIGGDARVGPSSVLITYRDQCGLAER